jgi:hypothetical protein
VIIHVSYDGVRSARAGIHRRGVSRPARLDRKLSLGNADGGDAVGVSTVGVVVVAMMKG